MVCVNSDSRALRKNDDEPPPPHDVLLKAPTPLPTLLLHCEDLQRLSFLARPGEVSESEKPWAVDCAVDGGSRLVLPQQAHTPARGMYGRGLRALALACCCLDSARALASVPLRLGCDGRARAPPALMADDVDPGKDSTWFTSLNASDEDGRVMADGTLPPGEDLVEKELKRIFNVESAEGTYGSGEIDELKLLYKLRKELGDDIFAQIFDKPNVRGLDVF